MRWTLNFFVLSIKSRSDPILQSTNVKTSKRSGTLRTTEALTEEKAFKYREDKARINAVRLGLLLRKCRSKSNPYVQGTYGFLNAVDNSVEVGVTSTGFGLTLEEIKRSLIDGL